MQIEPEIKSIMSSDLVDRCLPDDPANCAVNVEVEIGPKGGAGAEIFYFTAITPEYLACNPETRWGRGLLVIEEFTWEAVQGMLGRLLMHARKDTWAEVTAELSKELHWEYENYQKGPN